ncbi:aspartyl protease family protein [Luteimonas sp. RC10]|uniref:aspartyl protease family protein n=1 Tax=Luteimonas sp. RC10 TaxID=2587035 RepID=UPI00161A26E0|nr:aspartyl protease family protein [Luteimonas sp. RC10]MBB3344788.1 putative aspartyl protease [Luteimonas sp. RC10]
MRLTLLCRTQVWILTLVAVAWLLTAACARAWSPPDAEQRSTGIEELMSDAEAGDVFALERYTGTPAPVWHAIAKVRVAAARLRTEEAAALARAVIDDPQVPAAARASAWSVLADAFFADGRYDEAHEAGHHWQQALRASGASARPLAGAHRLSELAAALSNAPRQTVAAYIPQSVLTARDKVGLSRATVHVNGHAQEAVLDTGAGLSVVSRTTAERLGLHLLEAPATIDSSTRDGVHTRIGVADSVDFAGLSLRNVAFLVIDDAQLSMPLPGGYSIPAIVGFPVLRELKRIRFDHDGKLVPEPEARSNSSHENMRIVGSGLYVDVAIEGVQTALHLDSGAPSSFLNYRFALRHPRFVQGQTIHDEKLAGAGGTSMRRAARLPSANLVIDGKRATLTDLSVTIPEGAEAEVSSFGVLGGDVLDQFHHWTIDFRSMTFELGSSNK